MTTRPNKREQPDARLMFAARHFIRRRTRWIEPTGLPSLAPSRVRDVLRLIRIVRMRNTSSLAAVLLMSLIALGCSQRKAAFYCYDGGQIYIGDPDQKVWNGLGGI